MIGLVAALALSAASPGNGAGPLEARLRDSAAAAVALQGPLDGAWTLYDARRHQLYRLQISDPPPGSGPLDAAWRGPGASTTIGGVTSIGLGHGQLTIVLTPDRGSESVTLGLTETRHGAWAGWMTSGRGRHRVALRRSR